MWWVTLDVSVKLVRRIALVLTFWVFFFLESNKTTISPHTIKFCSLDLGDMIIKSIISMFSLNNKPQYSQTATWSESSWKPLGLFGLCSLSWRCVSIFSIETCTPSPLMKEGTAGASSQHTVFVRQIEPCLFLKPASIVSDKWGIICEQASQDCFCKLVRTWDAHLYTP